MDKMNVLFVDDELFTLHALERLLYKERFGRYFAQSAAEALEVMQENSIHVIVSDMKMPEMDGLALLARVKEDYPDIIRMALSAHTQVAQVLPCINTGHLFKFITKPLEINDLKSSLYQAFEYYSLKREKNELLEQLTEKNSLLEEALMAKRETEKRLRRMTIVDPLTGLYNRRHLQAVLDREFKRWKRHHLDCSCLVIELDCFRRMKEDSGHDIGDEVLVNFAGRLRNVIRDMDDCFRYGGEKFVVVLPDTTVKEAELAAQRVLEERRRVMDLSSGETLIVTASIGVASFAGGGAGGWASILKRAEIQLLHVKGRGRNQLAVCVG